ncbi:uncharacterized protein EI90DRAFT_2994468 [Cantharellus anzutake]|uniref:uncharacterized protein n=1 Tax=Cantharellus anzutake TaxID=1750568 RepID=UPI0019034A5A|nr:uncharacterized protein EI90DRAFT_2994468 [Cantharellus anzutake]KAF8333531.1 hypothetical protein EI90DRAFT_2994468 [Cantharellus anzutake]
MESPANPHLLSAGAKCAHPHCGLYDYLPYKCQYCEESFCADHFRPSAHQCEKEVNNDRVAPPCPLCKTPVTIPMGEDPNIAMERHFNTACEVMGKKKSGSPRCARAHCEKVLHAPIQCEACKKQFCATHRHPTSHKCVASPSSVSPLPKAPQNSPSKLRAFAARLGTPAGSSPRGSSSSTVTPAKPVAQSPIKAPTLSTASSVTSGKILPSPAQGPPGTSSASTSRNLFSKTDRSVVTKSSLSTVSVPVKSTTPFHTSPSTSPKSPSSPLQGRASTTSMEAVQADIASKPKPHIEISSFIPRPLFGTA